MQINARYGQRSHVLRLRERNSRVIQQRAPGNSVQGNRMQRRLVPVPQESTLTTLNLRLDPIRNFWVIGHGGFCAVGRPRGLLRLLRRPHERGEPGMPEKHIVRRALVGVLIHACANKSVGFFRVRRLGKLWRLAMDDGLQMVSIHSDSTPPGVLTCNWLKMLVNVSGGYG
jgi:hypothetical protein